MLPADAVPTTLRMLPTKLLAVCVPDADVMLPDVKVPVTLALPALT